MPHLQLRLDDTTLRQVDVLIEKYGAEQDRLFTRSEVARILIKLALEHSEKVIAACEIILTVRQAQQTIIKRTIAGVQEELAALGFTFENDRLAEQPAVAPTPEPEATENVQIATDPID